MRGKTSYKWALFRFSSESSSDSIESQRATPTSFISALIVSLSMTANYSRIKAQQADLDQTYQQIIKNNSEIDRLQSSCDKYIDLKNKIDTGKMTLAQLVQRDKDQVANLKKKYSDCKLDNSNTDCESIKYDIEDAENKLSDEQDKQEFF